MLVLIKYHNINIRMTIQGSVQGDFVFEIYTQEELSKCLYQILDQRTPNGNYAFYLYVLYIEGPNKSKVLPNYIIQHLFNEVIQLFIDLKEQDRICTDNVNNIILNVEFNDSKDLSSTKLVGKLIQVYNTAKSIIISLYTGISLSEIQESLVDKDLSVWCKNNKLISNAKKKMKPNIVLPLNSEEVNSSSETLQRNDELMKDDLTITKYVKVEDGLTEEPVDCCFTSAWYDLCACSIM